MSFLKQNATGISIGDISTETSSKGLSFDITNPYILKLHSASTTSCGILTIGTQTIGGDKTFDGYTTLSGGIGLTGTSALYGPTTISGTTSITGPLTISNTITINNILSIVEVGGGYAGLVVAYSVGSALTLRGGWGQTYTNPSNCQNDKILGQVLFQGWSSTWINGGNITVRSTQAWGAGWGGSKLTISLNHQNNNTQYEAFTINEYGAISVPTPTSGGHNFNSGTIASGSITSDGYNVGRWLSDVGATLPTSGIHGGDTCISSGLYYLRTDSDWEQLITSDTVGDIDGGSA